MQIPAAIKRQGGISDAALSLLVAEAGFEPHDLRVMSPTSYQAAPLRDMDFCFALLLYPFFSLLSIVFQIIFCA